MSQFYLSNEPVEPDLQRCREAVLDGRPITITGASDDGSIRAFTRVVQSVQDLGQGPKRYRITILD